MHKKIVIILFIVVLGLLAYYLSARQNNQTMAPDTSLQIVSPTPQTIPSDLPEVSDLQARGSTYRNPDGLYTIVYPSDYTQDTQDNGKIVTFTKRGETQRPQTELYDGALVVIQVEPLNGKTLSEWVDEHIETSTSNGMMELVIPKQSTLFNAYPAYSYTLRGLGTTEYRAIQKATSSESALVLTTLVADPEGRGYKQEVDAMLATLEILN